MCKITRDDINQKVGKMTEKNKRRKNKANKCDKGNELIREDQEINNSDYMLDWFKPTKSQEDIIYSECINDLTITQASSGCGKSTTAIYRGLKGLKSGTYSHIVFIKTPDESGDDQIGYLSGSESQKLHVHFESMRTIFHDFMSPRKLEMEEKRGRIKFTIPNFIKGRTLYNSLVIIDEAQSISPTTMKLLLERLGNGSKAILLGDKYQTYSNKHRKDGLTHLINMVTKLDGNGNRISKVDNIGYVEIPASENMRSDISKKIVELYEEEFRK